MGSAGETWKAKLLRLRFDLHPVVFATGFLHATVENTVHVRDKNHVETPEQTREVVA